MIIYIDADACPVKNEIIKITNKNYADGIDDAEPNNTNV